MATTRTDHNQTFGPDGTLLADVAVEVDITERTNREDLRSKAQQALAVNATFLALGAPTNPQVIAQVQRLTRENTAIIRLLLGLLDDTSGT